MRDKSKEIVGIEHVLEEEERIASAIAVSIYPLLIPTFQYHTWRTRDILLLTFPRSPWV